MTSTLLSNKFENICSKAKIVSMNSNMNIKLGACVIYRGKIIHYGTNSNVRTIINRKLFPAIHAEVNVVNKFINSNCKFNKKGKDLYYQSEKNRYISSQIYFRWDTSKFTSMQSMSKLYVPIKTYSY